MNSSSTILITCLGMTAACVDHGSSSGDTDELAVSSANRSLGAISRGIVSVNGDAERDLNLLARIEVQPNELVEFYEPAPGLVMISVAGAPDGGGLIPKHMIQGRSIEEVWRMAAGSTEIPASLLAALTREQERSGRRHLLGSQADMTGSRRSGGAARSGDLAAPESPSASGGSGGWCDDGWFSTSYSDCEYAWDFDVCLDNWWNGAYAQHPDAFLTTTAVCPAQGTVVLKVTTDEGVGGIWTVPENTHRWYSVQDDWCLFALNDCPFVRADVTHAAGDRFHFRFSVLAE